jgi:hypothetical protein
MIKMSTKGTVLIPLGVEPSIEVSRGVVAEPSANVIAIYLGNILLL